MPLADHSEFAGYTVIRLLGSGAMGEVYLARHPRLPRNDALKVLPADISSDPGYRERFVREADLAAGLWHPNIVSVLDRGEHEGKLWIAMAYVPGIDADELIRRRYQAGMPVNEVVNIITAVAGALDYAHGRGLLHRDVKPANIMLTEPDEGERRALLADFGIAHTIGEISGLTATNMTVGTVAYAAPEQLMGEDLDARADQYALAATAYHLLTGAPPFVHSNPAVVISHHLNVKPPSIGRTHPELSMLDAVFDVALAKDPGDRFHKCAEFARALSIARFEPAAAVSSPNTPTQADLLPVAATAVAPATNRPRPFSPRAAEPAPGKPKQGARRDDRLRRRVVLVASAVTVIALAVAAALLWPSKNEQLSAPETPSSATSSAIPPPSTDLSSAPATPAPATPSTEALRPVFAAAPARLPFSNLDMPDGIAVDNAGNIYVGDHDTESGRVLKLTPGSAAPTTLPFTGLGGPCALDADTAGDIYVLDNCSNAGSTLLKLPARATSPIELKPELRAGAKDLAVDSAGNLYLVASNRFGAWVYKLEPGSTTPTELPYTGLDSPTAIAVDANDNVYIAGFPGRVIKLQSGSNSPVTLPFTGLSDMPTGIAVDAAGTVYIRDFRFDDATSTSSSRVFALASGATSSTELPFPYLGQANGIAVNDAGVFVPSYGSSSTDKDGYVLLLRRAG
jgi:serine/threonine-protein kinase